MRKDQVAAEEIMNVLNAFNMMEFKMDLIITGVYVKDDDELTESFAQNIFGSGRIDFETKRQMIKEITRIKKIKGNTNSIAECGCLRNEVAHGIHLWRGAEVFTVGKKKKIEDFEKITRKLKKKIRESNDLLDCIIDETGLPVPKGTFLDYEPED